MRVKVVQVRHSDIECAMQVTMEEVEGRSYIRLSFPLERAAEFQLFQEWELELKKPTSKV